MHKNNTRRQGRIESSSLGETVRIASIVQKGMASGRSSYVEMRALDRLMKHNIKTRVNEMRKSIKINSSEIDRLLDEIISASSEGYTHVLTPNGIIQEKELDRLLSIDSEIVMCMRLLTELQEKEEEKEGGGEEAGSSNQGLIDTIKELIKDRKMFVDSIIKA